ncbi:hypothetical protein ABZ916_43880 [Streptomyces sp. NPDC046853]|uniref:DUF7134 domain-containing protein n=1 Tax=Streptomyces sp. NPDC046853 TaxID=3154920 RepID=UPI0033E3F3AD
MTVTPRSSPQGNTDSGDQGAPDQEDWSAGAQPLTRYVERGIQWVRAFDRRRPVVWDVLLTGLFVIIAFTDVLAGGWKNIAPNKEVDLWLVYTMTSAFSVPLLWRRRRPLAVYGVMALAMLVNGWTGAALQASLIMLIVLFNIAMRLPTRTLVWSYVLLAVPLVVGHLRYPQGSWDQWVVPTMMTYAIAALLGIAVRTRQD